MLSTPNNSAVPGTLRTTIVTHGNGNRVNVGDAGTASGIFGDLYVQAAAGPNTVNVDDSADSLAEPVTIDRHTDGGLLYTDVSIASGTIDVADGGTASLNVSGGAYFESDSNEYTVNATTPNTAVTLTTTDGSRGNEVDILGNSGNLTVNTRGTSDVVNVGGATDTLDSIQGPVTVNRAAGSVTLNVNDQGENAAEVYEIEPGVIQRGPLVFGQPYSPTQTIDYAGVANVVVNGGTAYGLYGVGGSPAGTSLTVNGGTAFNEWIIADTADNLDDIQGPLTLHSASGEDLLEDYDYLNAAPHTYTVTGQTVSRDGIQPIAASGFGDIVVFTPAVGGSTINVTSTSAQTASTVVVCESGDTLIVGAPVVGGLHTLQTIAGLLSIESVANSTPTVILDDSGDTGGAGPSRTVTFSQDPVYGDMVINGLAPAQINLPLGAGANVSVKGDAGNDIFAVDALPQGWDLALGGEGGTNTLDYSGYTGDVTVNLARGTATGLSSIQDFQNVVGSNGDDLLVGDANANVLTGGTGRNILIGGAGADQLIGGGGDNILIGGTTNYDLNADALESLRTEWDRTDIGFEARIADLMAGVGSGMASAALTGGPDGTVHADGAADTLDGGGQNWFFVAQADPDTVNDQKDGDVITTI